MLKNFTETIVKLNCSPKSLFYLEIGLNSVLEVYFGWS
jgi:hypothetical protein